MCLGVFVWEGEKKGGNLTGILQPFSHVSIAERDNHRVVRNCAEKEFCPTSHSSTTTIRVKRGTPLMKRLRAGIHKRIDRLNDDISFKVKH